MRHPFRLSGGIIDPLTLEYSESEDCFLIIGGERRYRAAKIIGLDRLPCIIKEVDDKTRFVMQFIANLQREDIPPLEEAAGIKHLMEHYSYTQREIGKLINKSKSYISQILGLERLSEASREIFQTSEISKEALIQASMEKNPEKQVKILKKASNEGQTIKQMCEDLIEEDSFDENPPKTSDSLPKQFKKWTWIPKHKGFIITVLFKGKQNAPEKVHLIRAALEEANYHLNNGTEPEGSYPSNRVC